MKNILLGAVATAALSATAFAAEAPAASWTGCYVGGNIGGGLGKNRADDTAPGNLSGLTNISSNTDTGVVGGGQIGCNVQVRQFVIGARGLLDGSSVSGTSPFSPAALATPDFRRTNDLGSRPIGLEH